MPTARSRAQPGENHVAEADPNLERCMRIQAREQRQRHREEQDARMADPRPNEIKLRDRAVPNANDFRSSIAEPEVTVKNFELNPGLILLVQQSQFGGSPMESPNVHLQKNFQLCNTVKMNGVSSDTIRLQLFPFSLRDKATEWLMSMPPNYFTTWDALSRAFLAKYFPPSKTAKYRHELNTFMQRDGESLYEVWERLKDLQRQCPHHGIPEWLVIKNFYNGLDQSVRSALDLAAGGSLMGKSDAQAKELIEEMALHNYHYGNPWGRSRGMFEVASSSMICGACGMTGHQSADCLQFGKDNQVEDVNAFNTRTAGNPYTNQNNSNWLNNPRFPNVSYPSQPYQNPNRPSDFTSENTNHPYQAPAQVPPVTPQESRTEELLEQLLLSQQKNDQENEQKFQQLFSKYDQLQAHNNTLEHLIAQMSAGTSQKDYGELPSQPEENQMEGANAFTLRSGQQLEDHAPAPAPTTRTEKRVETLVPKVSGGKMVEDHEKVYIPPPPYKPPLPFPHRIIRAKLEKQYGRFLANMQKLSINIPFLEALSQMPSYAKFLKELLMNKRNLGELEVVASTNVSSNGHQSGLSQQFQDSGSFSIPCSIGSFEIRKALCDLGESVSLIPLSLCDKLGMGNPKPTNVKLQMNDGSIKHPVGIIENVPLKVGKFFIPVDFVVLDMEEGNRTQIILGKPFLATTGAIIDMKGGKLTFQIGDETEEFHIFPAYESLPAANQCFMVDNFHRYMEIDGSRVTVKNPKRAHISQSQVKGSGCSLDVPRLPQSVVASGRALSGTMKVSTDLFKKNGAKTFENVVQLNHLF